MKFLLTPNNHVEIALMSNTKGSGFVSRDEILYDHNTRKYLYLKCACSIAAVLLTAERILKYYPAAKSANFYYVKGVLRS